MLHNGVIHNIVRIRTKATWALIKVLKLLHTCSLVKKSIYLSVPKISMSGNGSNQNIFFRALKYIISC